MSSSHSQWGFIWTVPGSCSNFRFYNRVSAIENRSHFVVWKCKHAAEVAWTIPPTGRSIEVSFIQCLNKDLNWRIFKSLSIYSFYFICLKKIKCNFTQYYYSFRWNGTQFLQNIWKTPTLFDPSHTVILNLMEVILSLNFFGQGVGNEGTEII